MGNSGDLIKHGMLAEFVDCYGEYFSTRLNYFDPFGGRPWQQPMHPIVKQRIARLKPCSLKLVQSQKYYGSGHIVNEISKKNGGRIQVYSSDRDPDARHDLLVSGIRPIRLNQFSTEDAYSILNVCLETERQHLILLDPFYELERINQTILPKIIPFVQNNNCYVMLFVLYHAPEISLWHNFLCIQESLTRKNVNVIALDCQANSNSTLPSESKYSSYVALYAPKNQENEFISKLLDNICQYAYNLQAALKTSIDFSYHI